MKVKMAVQAEQIKTLSPLQRLDLASKLLHRQFWESMRQFESAFGIQTHTISMKYR